jgi:hypothetical protein
LEKKTVPENHFNLGALGSFYHVYTHLGESMVKYTKKVVKKYQVKKVIFHKNVRK